MPAMQAVPRERHAPAANRLADFVCGERDSLFFAMKLCLGNGANACFVVDGRSRLLGQITLESIRAAMRAGELTKEVGLGKSVALLPATFDNGFADKSVAAPILDARGHLVDVIVDHALAPIPLAKPDLSHLELESMLDAFLSTWLSGRGPHVHEFERGYAEFAGSRYGIATSSGTAALHLALLALGIGQGDEVVVPDLTFAATINAVLHCGATPVIADIDPENWGLCPHALEKATTSQTKAVIPVHLYGRPVAMETIAYARKRRLAIIEDCAEAQGAVLSGLTVGSIGDVGCFSLFANKLVTTGEGGMCVTSSAALAASMRELRDHGVKEGEPFWHERVGYNYRITNLQAGIGLAQLRRFSEIREKRDRVERLYREYLSDIRGVRFPAPCAPGSSAVNWLVAVTVPADKRDELIAAANDEQIELRAFFHALSAMPPYRSFARECPNSLALSASGLCLPTSGNEDRQAVEKIAQIFRRVLGSPSGA